MRASNTTIEVTMRHAAPADAEAIALLNDQLGYPTTIEEARSRLDRILKLTDHAVFCAVEGPDVVGWILVGLRHPLESDDFAEILGLVVDHRCRRRGVGRMLVDQVEVWARSQGHRRLRVRSNLVRPESHRFYQSLGYELIKQQAVYDKIL